MRLRQLAVAMILMASSFSVFAVMPRYTITDLSTLGDTDTVGNSVNDSGQVTGYSLIWESLYTLSTTHAFITDSDNTIYDVGTFGGKSFGMSINSSGQVVGYSYYADNSKRAFITDNSGNMIDLGTFDGGFSEGYGINDMGEVTGVSSSDDGNHAFFTNGNGNMIDLGTLGGQSSIGHAINNNSQVTGQSSTVDGEIHAFIINRNGEMIDLGTLGGEISGGYAINDSGQVAGYSYTSDGNYHAFVTNTYGEMFDLGTLGGKSSTGYGINNSGQVVGLSNTSDGQNHAFVTDGNGNMYNLNDLVNNLSDNWTLLRFAFDISNNGYITGAGITKDGQSHAFLLTPIDEYLDTTTPTLAVPNNVEVEATSLFTHINIGTATATDDYSSVDISNDTPVNGFGLGTTIVTWTATDEAGNTSTATQTITVLDTTNPVLTIPADVHAEFGTTVNLGTATASDIFEPVVISNNAPDSFPIGITVVTWTATDASGNSVSAVQKVTVIEVVVLPPSPLNCSLGAIIISDTQYSTDISEQSEISITSNGTTTVKNGIDVTYQAPVITLKPGFHAVAGSQFTATAMRVSCTSEVGQVSTASRSLVGTTESVEQPEEIQENNIASIVAIRLTQSQLPSQLQLLLNAKDAIAHDIITDADNKNITFSSITSLLGTDDNEHDDVYLYHVANEELSLISFDINNEAANASSIEPRIDGTGEFVVYQSHADNLDVPTSDNNGVSDIYLYHIDSGHSIRVSWQFDDSETVNPSKNPSLSTNGYVVYDKPDEDGQHHIYGYDFDADYPNTEQHSLSMAETGLWIDYHKPSLSSDGRYLSYLGLGADSSCKIHIYDRDTLSFVQVDCPDELAGDMDHWDSSFDASAENILWYNYQTEEIIQIVNPLLD